jgi:hypothetical protein
MGPLHRIPRRKNFFIINTEKVYYKYRKGMHMNKKQMLIENLRYKIIKKLNENKHTPYYQFQNTTNPHDPIISQGPHNARLSREVYPGDELLPNAAQNQIISTGHRGIWQGSEGEFIESDDIHTITEHGKNWDPKNYPGLGEVKRGNLIRFEMRASGKPESFGARIKEALGITPKNNSDYYLGGGIIDPETGIVYQKPHTSSTIHGKRFDILHPSTANNMLSPSRSNPFDRLVSYKGALSPHYGRRVETPPSPMRAGYLSIDQIHGILENHFKSGIASSGRALDGTWNAANPYKFRDNPANAGMEYRVMERGVHHWRPDWKEKPTVGEFHGLKVPILPKPSYHGH